MSPDPNHYWFLASPYSQYPEGHHAAYLLAAKAAGLLTRHRVPHFSPITHCHTSAIMASLDPTDLSIWLPVMAPFRHHAHGIILLKGKSWESSKGMNEEWAEFKAQDKPAIFMDPGVVPIELIGYSPAMVPAPKGATREPPFDPAKRET